MPAVPAFMLALWLASGAAAQTAKPVDTMAQRMLACSVCHGQEGRAGPDGYLPRIAGKTEGYLYAQLLSFRDGRRHNAAMAQLFEHLSDDYLREIAAYFAGLELPYPPPAAPAAPPAVLARGERLVREGDPARSLPSCNACHATTMTGMAPATPGLLGLPRDYLIAQLGGWKTGLRRAAEPDCMATVAKRLDDSDITAIAAWLAAQPVPAGARAAPAPTEALPLACSGSGPAR